MRGGIRFGIYNVYFFCDLFAKEMTFSEKTSEYLPQIRAEFSAEFR